MDPLSAIGLASAIVTFIAIGTEITLRLEELSEAGDVPKVFRNVRTRLPLIISIVSRTQQNVTNLSPEAKVSFEGVVNQCNEQVDHLKELVEKVTIDSKDSRWRRGVKAALSLIEEHRVERIGAALLENVHLLTSLNVTPAEKEKSPAARRASGAPPAYASAAAVFLLPFERDDHFVGREDVLHTITKTLEVQSRVAVAGIGGVG
jgi:hypothetical protein